MTREKRLVPTGDCFCGCGGEAGIGRWFVLGHDITAAGALRAVEGGLSLPQRLVEAGFGPERSVVDHAVNEAGWVRCGGCVYAGTPAGLAAHTRTGSCTAGKSPSARGGEGAGAVMPQPAAARGLPPGEAGSPAAGSVPPVRAEAGAARGLLLPGEDDPSWEGVPLHLRQALRGAAHHLVTPVAGPLKAREQRRVLSAVRAAVRMRMTGAHWLLLLTTEREALGSPRSARADAFCRVLMQILAGHPPLALGQQHAPAAPGETSAG
ncbi:hypothetical protein [Streptomyces yaizuensis]|uniref:Uncharacterized protein n=1 Tax=Streptomyces yaizuensis TaxID=2989713 RepID=A0ABQ5P633_9ACTN|nr:hypothetical protein [Streptomyces sp. YSPA8]GLF98036.1 hypothetical protein SYYSPA8_27085 [Streptomyces sp. YSPA8]